MRGRAVANPQWREDTGSKFLRKSVDPIFVRLVARHAYYHSVVELQQRALRVWRPLTYRLPEFRDQRLTTQPQKIRHITRGALASIREQHRSDAAGALARAGRKVNVEQATMCLRCA